MPPESHPRSFPAPHSNPHLSSNLSLEPSLTNIKGPSELVAPFPPEDSPLASQDELTAF